MGHDSHIWAERYDEDFEEIFNVQARIASRVADQLDHVDRILIYVGGLPEIREWPFEYKAVFSPIDVIAEYPRPARFKINGEIVTRPALTEVEEVVCDWMRQLVGLSAGFFLLLGQGGAAAEVTHSTASAGWKPPPSR